MFYGYGFLNPFKSFVSFNKKQAFIKKNEKKYRECEKRKTVNGFITVHLMFKKNALNELFAIHPM